jgi:hypothetical protein
MAGGQVGHVKLLEVDLPIERGHLGILEILPRG